MKSSIMTMSCLRSSNRPGASVVVIRTDAMRASPNMIPMKDRFPSPGEGGTELVNISLPPRLKYSILRIFRLGIASSIWLVNVCEDRAEASDRGFRSAVAPGDEEDASVMLLPAGVNNRDGLKVLKILS